MLSTYPQMGVLNGTPPQALAILVVQAQVQVRVLVERVGLAGRAVLHRERSGGDDHSGITLEHLDLVALEGTFVQCHPDVRFPGGKVHARQCGGVGRPGHIGTESAGRSFREEVGEHGGIVGCGRIGHQARRHGEAGVGKPCFQGVIQELLVGERFHGGSGSHHGPVARKGNDRRIHDVETPSKQAGQRTPAGVAAGNDVPAGLHQQHVAADAVLLPGSADDLLQLIMEGPLLGRQILACTVLQRLVIRRKLPLRIQETAVALQEISILNGIGNFPFSVISSTSSCE